jgi:hypothetical protein
MQTTKVYLLTASILLMLCIGSCHRSNLPDYDIVIYGGTSAGVIAAVTAKKMGKSVVVIEDHEHLGGMSSSGLGWTDYGNAKAIQGAAREFYRRLGTKYDKEIAWQHEPNVAEKVFMEMLTAYDIPFMLNERLDLQDGVDFMNNRITRITLESGETLSGSMFIDASYEGDLMASAGVSFTYGRESEATYGENLNGVRRGDTDRLLQYTQGDKDHFKVDVDPYIIQGDPASGIIPHVVDLGLHNGTGNFVQGTGDKKTQAYTYRLCVSKDPDNIIPFPKPADYDENEFELLFRIFEAGDNRLPLKIDALPNSKFDINSLHSFSTDGGMLNWSFPTGDYETRDIIIERQIRYEQGIIWTLANHPRVPQTIRDEVRQYGLAKDEFIRNGGWPYEIYIREARRMVSDYVMTQHNAEGTVIAADPVAEASFGMDSHVVQIFINEQGRVHREGVIWRVPPRPYGISYRSIVPKTGETENLFVPVCLSASHVAHGSIRMEPQFMMLGQAAALAATLAIDENIPVQNVNYALLADLIKKQNAIISSTVKRPHIK